MKILTITAGTSFDIIISALANPSQPIAVDMNAIVLWVADSTRVMTTACSTQLTNQLPIITFITGTNFLILNNMLTIYITLGTYSTPITVTAADGTLFQSNINLTLVNPALSFNPNPLYLYVDTSSSSFSIGASQYLIPTTYMFKMVKKESSVVSQYGVYNWYVVKVRNGVVRVDIPNSVKVPIGGCSLPVKLELTNAPF